MKGKLPPPPEGDLEAGNRSSCRQKATSARRQTDRVSRTLSKFGCLARGQEEVASRFGYNRSLSNPGRVSPAAAIRAAAKAEPVSAADR
jgi:hypothetical protein